MLQILALAAGQRMMTSYDVQKGQVWVAKK